MSASNGSTEMDKVLFYNSNLTETDINILQLIEGKKDIFGDGIEYNPPAPEPK